MASVPGFKGVRKRAASVEISDGWWVTGYLYLNLSRPFSLSFVGGKGSLEALATTEVWNGTNWVSHDPLPRPMYGHCMV